MNQASRHSARARNRSQLSGMPTRLKIMDSTAKTESPNAHVIRLDSRVSANPSAYDVIMSQRSGNMNSIMGHTIGQLLNGLHLAVYNGFHPEQALRGHCASHGPFRFCINMVTAGY